MYKRQMVGAVHENKQYLGDIDGLIGDGDHGMNMNKGFVTYGERLGDNETTFTDGLTELGMVLLNEIGGSMGPIYGTIFMEMADAAEDAEDITLSLFGDMLAAGLEGLYGIVDARPGDKTLVDTLNPCVECVKSLSLIHIFMDEFIFVKSWLIPMQFVPEQRIMCIRFLKTKIWSIICLRLIIFL